MNDHDEILFQRVSKDRAKYVAELRAALNAAGLREKGAAPAYAHLHNQSALLLQQAQAGTEGYDIERVIQAATALRVALEPFDTSLPRARNGADA